MTETDAFEEAVSYAEMLKESRDEVGESVFQAAKAMANTTDSESQRISNANDALEGALARTDHVTYREELANGYVQDPLDLAAAVSRFDALVQDLFASLDE